MSSKFQIIIKDWYGWKSHSKNNYTLWFKGYLLDTNIESLFRKSMDLLNNSNISDEELSNFCNHIRGHFSLLIYSKNKIFCFVDRVRTIPLFYIEQLGTIIISNHAIDLKNNINRQDINIKASLEIAMSGYTMNGDTIFNNLKQLNAGEYLFYKDDLIKIGQYYRYSPWNVRERTKTELKNELTKISKIVIEDMAESCRDRQIAILLSAGNDSRLIASGLKELNVKDVICFSYGSKNSFEVETAKKIADHLSYKWFHIPLSIFSQKKSFREDSFFDYWNFSDTLTNSPILMDYTAVKEIANSKYLSKEAIFVNGNTGDFITGGHIPNDISENDQHTVEEILDKYVNKHYSLWSCLKTTTNINVIKDGLHNLVLKILEENSLSENNLWALSESLEWSGRQSKFVTAVQRSYEFFGYDWRLPLWDPLYIDFWESVPKEYKLKQSLYREWLTENNWGDVWRNININEFQLSSSKIRFVRSLFKALFVMLGKERWRSFDQRVFSYFLDNTASTAIEPYKNVLFDSCGARNRNSWIAKKYLKTHNINFESFYEN